MNGDTLSTESDAHGIGGLLEKRMRSSPIGQAVTRLKTALSGHPKQQPGQAITGADMTAEMAKRAAQE